MITSLLPVLVFFGLVGWGITRLIQRRNKPGTDAAGAPTRRLLVYVLGYGLLSAIAWAVISLLAEITTERIAGTNAAFSIAVLLIASPVYIGLARWVHRLLEQPTESEATGWAFYLTATSLTGLWATTAAVIAIAYALLRDDRVPEWAPFIALVWAAVWASHWQLAKWFGHAPKLRFERLVGSATGLVIGWAGIAGAVVAVLDVIFTATPINDTSRPFFPVVLILVGATIWSWYWVRHELSGERTPLWEGYVLLLGSVIALLITMGGAWGLLLGVVSWALDGNGDSFQDVIVDLAPAAAALVSSGMVWWYHRQVFKLNQERTDIVRLHDYLLSGAGLVFVVAALSILIVAALQTLWGTSISSNAQEPLVASITGLIVAAPLWWLYWSSAQRSNNEDELQSGARRGYVFAIFGLGGTASIIAAINVLNQLLRLVLGESDSAGLLDRVDGSVAIIVTTGLTAWYHWQIHQSDRERMPEEEKSRTVTVATSDGHTVEQVSKSVAKTTSFVVMKTEAMADITPEELMSLIEENPSGDLLVVPTSGGWTVVALSPE